MHLAGRRHIKLRSYQYVCKIHSAAVIPENPFLKLKHGLHDQTERNQYYFSTATSMKCVLH